MKCENCTGSHYLADMEGLGPCPSCCTPEALQRAEAELAKSRQTIAAMAATKSLPELLDELEGIASQTRDAYAALVTERDEAHDVINAATAALQAHLVELQYAAAPTVTPPGALGELCKTLDVCA